MIDKNAIEAAYKRISPYIINTPVITSPFLNEHLGNHEIFFKAEPLQLTGAFKIRGVLNTILTLKNEGNLPKRIVTYSSGNHAKAISWAAKEFGLSARVYMPENSSMIKMQAVKDYGAELIVTKTRAEAEIRASEDGKLPGHLFLHPSDNDMVICGAATLAYESLIEMNKTNDLPDAIFGACGGGALISGTYLAAKAIHNDIKIFAAEPKNANDAARSYALGKIVGFETSPQTIADGVVTLKVSARTFEYIKKLDGFFEILEEEIIYWTAWLEHLLKITTEPTAALSMAAAYLWLKQQTQPKKVLVLLSGGNIDQVTMQKIWEHDHLQNIPCMAPVNIDVC